MNAAAIQRIGAAAALREVTDTTRRVFNRANVLTPVDTGRLRVGNQWRVQVVSPTRVVGEVFNHTAYAAAVHDGSRAHVVRPRRKKALRFEVAGRVVFARRAFIPARRGRPWLLRALVEVAGPAGYHLSQR
jgi:hypothetical protein